MYDVIRASDDFEVIIVAFLDGGNPDYDNPATQYLEYHRDILVRELKSFREVENLEKLADAGDTHKVFRPISRDSALICLSGIADGMGFGEFRLLKCEFASLQELWTEVRRCRAEYMKEWQAKLAEDCFGTPSGVEADKFELMDLMMSEWPLTKSEFFEKLRKHGLENLWSMFEERYKDKFKKE